MRHRRRRPRRVETPCGGAQRTGRLGGGGPRLDERLGGQRGGARGRACARERRSDRARLDDAALRRAMTTLEPVSVALKFGFLAVMYLFVLWVARSAGRDLRRDEGRAGAGGPVAAAPPPDATGLYSASALGAAPLTHRAP